MKSLMTSTKDVETFFINDSYLHLQQNSRAYYKIIVQ